MAIHKNRRAWEDELVLSAHYFTCSVPKVGQRQRGQRLEWDVTDYPTLKDAVLAAQSHPRALVYAVDGKGNSAPLSRSDWGRYMQMRCEL